MLDLPHQYPFRLVDRLDRAGDGDESRVTVLLSEGRATPRSREGGTPPLALSLAIEMMAQAALAVLPRDPERDGQPMGLLAGVTGARLHGRAVSGDRLVARTRLLGRFGPAVKAACSLRTEAGEPVAEAELLLSFAP